MMNAIEKLPSQLLIEQRITAEEQLKRLRFPIADKVDDLKVVISELADLIASYAVDPVFANWYTAYTELKFFLPFPEEFPPLPDDIHTEIDQWKKKGLIPALYFVPGGTLKEMARGMKDYWLEKHPGEKNPLKFRYIWKRILKQYGNVRVEPHWALISDIPFETRNKSYDQQVAYIKTLDLQCEAPRLYSIVAVMFQHKIATGENLYPEGNAQNKDLSIYTRVQEAIRGWRLYVGGFASFGLGIAHNYERALDDIGIALFRKF